MEVSSTSKNKNKKQKQKRKRNPKHFFFIIEQNISNLLPTKLQSPTETLKWYKKEKRNTSLYFFFFCSTKKIDWHSIIENQQRGLILPSVRLAGCCLKGPGSSQTYEQKTLQRGDRQTDGRTERQDETQTDRQTERRTDGQTDRQEMMLLMVLLSQSRVSHLKHAT